MMRVLRANIFSLHCHDAGIICTSISHIANDVWVTLMNSNFIIAVYFLDRIVHRTREVDTLSTSNLTTYVSVVAYVAVWHVRLLRTLFITLCLHMGPVLYLWCYKPMFVSIGYVPFRSFTASSRVPLSTQQTALQYPFETGQSDRKKFTIWTWPTTARYSLSRIREPLISIIWWQFTSRSKGYRGWDTAGFVSGWFIIDRLPVQNRVVVFWRVVYICSSSFVHIEYLCRQIARWMYRWTDKFMGQSRLLRSLRVLFSWMRSSH